MEKTLNKIFNIPNSLSMFRMVLIPLFIYFYMCAGPDAKLFYLYACITLVVSGFTDLIDGVVARKCNQITNLGKILDPLADKLTQVAVVICIAVKMNSSELTAVLMIFVVKELLMLIGGAIMLKNKITIRGSKWYGKIATAVFYVVMAAIALFEMPLAVMIGLVSVAAIFMLFAFAQYIREYFKIMKENKSQTE